MRTRETLLLALATLPALWARSPAQEHRHQPPVQQSPEHRMRVQHQDHLLATTAWLGSYLDSSGVVVLHVGRGDSLYRSGHIPGARFLPLAAVATMRGGLPNEFPPAEELAATFRDLGVGDLDRIVIYGDDSGLMAARAWVALDLLRHGDRAALLDGGLARWVAEGRPTETAARAPAPRPFSARWRREKVVDAAWVRARLRDSTVLLVDARPADQFAGEEPPCGPAPACAAIPPERRGRIPGARNLFWMNALVSRDDPVLKPLHALHHELWEPLGADRPAVRTIVTYCRTGMQSSHAYFVARYLGYPDVRMFDGSFIEWASLAPGSYPVERSAR